jgi:hypothetical protein
MVSLDNLRADAQTGASMYVFVTPATFVAQMPVQNEPWPFVDHSRRERVPLTRNCPATQFGKAHLAHAPGDGNIDAMGRSRFRLVLRAAGDVPGKSVSAQSEQPEKCSRVRKR